MTSHQTRVISITQRINQVERLAGDRFKMVVLRLWVPVGVALGVTLGVFAIISRLENPMLLIIQLLVVLYPIACILDVYAQSSLVAAAWDRWGHGATRLPRATFATSLLIRVPASHSATFLR